MGTLISGIRIWSAIICISFLGLSEIILFVAETVVLIFTFPFYAVFTNKENIKESWIGSYPNLPDKINKGIRKVWKWALFELDDPDIVRIILSSIVGIFVLGLPISIVTLTILFWDVLPRAVRELISAILLLGVGYLIFTVSIIAINGCDKKYKLSPVSL